MDWLKDKKNQPIVAAIAAIVIVGVAALLYFTMFKGDSDSAESAPPQVDPAGMDGGMPPMPGGMPPMPGAMPQDGAQGMDQGAAPAAAPAAKTGGDQATAAPIEVARKDPFLPIGYKPPPKGVRKPIPHITDFPFISLPHPRRDEDEKKNEKEEPQPSRRMAGLLLNGRVYAIIETNGKTEVVQPGDTLDDRLAMVERIEQDKVVLKTITGAKPRYITVRMAAAPKTDYVTTSSGSESAPLGPYTGGPMPPMPFPMGPPMPRGRGM